MSGTEHLELNRRQLAVLVATAEGRCELSSSCEPDVFVDGLCCCDHSVGGLLLRAGLVRRATLTLADQRVPVEVTELGYALLAQQAGWHRVAALAA